MTFWTSIAASALIFIAYGVDKGATNPILAHDESSYSEIFGNGIRVQRSVTSHHNHHHRNYHDARKHGKAVTRCPPPMTRLPDDACTVESCLSDSECTAHGHKCCYNGCLYTCVHVVHPPPVIDWQTKLLGDDNIGSLDEDLSPDEYEGNLEFDIIPGEMLIASHQGGETGEMCSTTVEEGDILMDCPHGYICHVEDPGDPSLGIPDRGMCIAVNEDILDAYPASQEDDFFY